MPAVALVVRMMSSAPEPNRRAALARTFSSSPAPGPYVARTGSDFDFRHRRGGRVEHRPRHGANSAGLQVNDAGVEEQIAGRDQCAWNRAASSDPPVASPGL